MQPLGQSGSWRFRQAPKSGSPRLFCHCAFAGSGSSASTRRRLADLFESPRRMTAQRVNTNPAPEPHTSPVDEGQHHRHPPTSRVLRRQTALLGIRQRPPHPASGLAVAPVLLKTACMGGNPREYGQARRPPGRPTPPRPICIWPPNGPSGRPCYDTAVMHRQQTLPRAVPPYSNALALHPSLLWAASRPVQTFLFPRPRQYR